MVIKKLKASTLVETIVAMVVICLVFFIASLVLVNFRESDNRIWRIRAVGLADSVYYSTVTSKHYIDEEFISANFLINKKCDALSEYNNILELFIEIRKDEKIHYSGKYFINK